MSSGNKVVASKFNMVVKTDQARYAGWDCDSEDGDGEQGYRVARHPSPPVISP